MNHQTHPSSLPFIASGHPTLHDPTLPLPLQLSRFSYSFPGERIDPKPPDTAWHRANRRAKKLMKEAGVWEESDTFAQHKRRRKGGA